MSAVDTLADKAEAASQRPADAPAGPPLDMRPCPTRGGGPSPFAVVGLALAAGVALAKWIDRRGHGHPR